MRLSPAATAASKSNEANEIFAWHFEQYLVAASRQAIVAAAEVATDRRELLQFAEWRFRGLIYGFEASYFDCLAAIGRPFEEAAKASKGRRP
jgi:hypothetical protein